jgi:ribose 5-phosphate isomerase B
MKQFDIITESDAHVLERGETIVLARRGHITPLAADTLKERRITVITEDQASADEVSLVPRAPVRSVAIASDHTGVALRKALVTFLRGRGLAIDDMGTEGTDPVDYPDVAARVARAVSRGEADAGIVIDGAGIGSAIAANKIPGIRAVMAANETIARYSRAHNGANVLTLGASLLSEEEARGIVTTWLETAMTEPRYIRRLTKIRDLERQGAKSIPGLPGRQGQS